MMVTPLSSLRHFLLCLPWRPLPPPSTLQRLSSYRVSKVPQESPVSRLQQPSTKPFVDLNLVQLLERLSLVDFANREGIKVLQEAISIADQLSEVNTEGVEPMVTVLEDRSLPLAEDLVTCGNQKEELLSCAHTTLEDYLVVPPGNITYSEERCYYTDLTGDAEDEGAKT